MALDPRIQAVADKYGLQDGDFWELPQKKGTWIAKHAALEMAAAKAAITFDNPITIEANTEAGIAVVSVRGELPFDAERHNGRSEWSIGEASPKNNKNAYPWAMAEKRAKDRVILKLIGLHGLTYSEDEADDFKQPSAPAVERLSSYRAKTMLNSEAMLKEIDNAATLQVLDNLYELYTVTVAPWFPGGWAPRLLDRIAARRNELETEPVGTVDPNDSLDRQYADMMR